ncbi:MAG: crosslink repair DNA glycosylase YcaQ family protein [Litoreibacter sp.]|uniref:winged helix-turn-helix domain-containing protein n=1 Tax=Litoreibacter sp. TaxID=1969459 RepID=UPI0032968BC5
MTLPLIPLSTVRLHHLARHRLCEAPTGTGKGDDLHELFQDLTFVQLDSINTVSRAHHMIMHARRTNYRPKALDKLMSERLGFEHWTHDASVIDMENFGHWKLKFTRDAVTLKSRYKNWRRDGFEAKFDTVLQHISDHGACSSSDVGTDEKKGSGGWWDWHPSKTALEYLWRSGKIAVTHRQGFRKFYDLTERVIPARHLEAEFAVEDTINHCCATALNRLGFATSGEIAAFWDVLSPAETKEWCARELAQGTLIEVMLETAQGKPRRSFARPDVLASNPIEPTKRIRILSPFDPALRDRKRTERVFGFHYRIEVFVPAPKRQYGYYVFPVLEGERLIGRIDMKADRARDTMTVRAFWPEDGVRMGAGRVKSLITAIERTTKLADVTELEFATDWVR